MILDRTAYPRLAHYIDALPSGLGAHPGAQTRADFSLILRERLNSYLSEATLPVHLRTHFATPWKPGDWIPTTTYVALCAVARDRFWQTDAAYHQGMLDVATEMYKGPVYRAMFFMFGPSMVAMSASKRWHTLHQGTELSTTNPTKESIDIELKFPDKLLPDYGVQSLGAAFCAVAQGSRGKNPTFTLLGLTNTTAQMRIGWTY